MVADQSQLSLGVLILRGYTAWVNALKKVRGNFSLRRPHHSRKVISVYC